MYISLRVLLLLILCNGICIPVMGQLFNQNPPTITGQRPTPLLTEKNTSITIAFQNLRVSDPDIFMPAYPQGYTLKVYEGSNYTLSKATVTPAPDFVGTLTVPVQVNDGKFDSNIFQLKIDVTNIKPVITDQENISIKEGVPLAILLSHLKVQDGDNDYPQDFTLTVYDGDNYSVSGNTIEPDGRFSGKLKVMVSVNDGHVESNKFEMTIDVKANIIPVIKGQGSLSTNQRSPITLSLTRLIVQDSDNNYPADFTLKVFEGNNYTVKDSTVTPNANFVGTLRVPVTVHDGLDESKKFEVRIEVIRKVNTPPQINGQRGLITNEDQSLPLKLNDLVVVDNDNDYPNGFTLKILSDGPNYTAAGNVITPLLNFNGELEVPIAVNDGDADSPPYPLSIVVTPVNDPPVITGQDPITIPAGKPTALQATSLVIADPDKQLPSSFSLRILPGENYTATGNVINTDDDIEGKLTVKVVVNDGVVDSAPYNLDVEVVARGSAPLITGQQFLMTYEDSLLRIELSDLVVTDDNNTYPIGFTLLIHPGIDYTFSAQTITPSLNKNGMITVNVTVNDGKENSPPFPLKVYILPVNDAPMVTMLEESDMPYEPGSAPAVITKKILGEDVDSPYLSFAEVGFDESTFSALHDELIFQNTTQIRGIYDPSKGILSMIGYAPKELYDSAMRSIKYNYMLTLDEAGNQTEVLPGKKKIFFTLNDGQLVSDKAYRTISIESSSALDIPNSFTPNADRVNDTWHVRPVTDASRFDKAIIRVYNKRGLLIFETKGFEKSWDGSFNGEILPVDTYYYTINLNLSYVKKTYSGTVTILR